MIFGSFGLLVVALALLIAAVVKSSVAIGIGSLVCTGVAVGLLVAANAHYRRTAGGQRPATGADGAAGPSPHSPVPATMVMFPQMAMAGAPQPNGHGGPFIDAGTWADPALDNYDQLSAAQAVSAVVMLNLDQLHGLRRHEVEHLGRKTVLSAIDDRISAIVKLRRSLGT